MKFSSILLALWLAAGGAAAQQAPEATFVAVGPMPPPGGAEDRLWAAVTDYARTSCGISIFLQADPASFPTEAYASSADLAQKMGVYFAQTFSLSTRVFVVDEAGRAPRVLSFVNGHLFARLGTYQNFSLTEFTEMGSHLAVANHSIKRIQKEILEELLGHDRRLVDLTTELIQIDENRRDLAEAQLLLQGVFPEDVVLSASARANPTTKIERDMVAFLDAQDAIYRGQAELVDARSKLELTEARIAQNDCLFAAPDKLYGAEDIATLRGRVARDTERLEDDVSDADIMRWIVETGFGTPVFEK